MGQTRCCRCLCPSPLIPDDVTFPLLPFRTEAAHALPVQKGSLFRQRPHHAVSGCDLGQRVRTVDLYGSGTGAIHTETCQGDGKEAPRDTQSAFHTSSLFCLLIIIIFLVFCYMFFHECLFKKNYPTHSGEIVLKYDI